MSMTTSRASRLAAGVLAGSLTLLPLTACSFGTDTLSCSASECSVTLTCTTVEADSVELTASLG